MLKKILRQINRLKGNDIFISYSRADSLDYALSMANSLATQQYFCYLDQFHNHPGEKIPDELLDALRKSSAMIVILSRRSLESKAMLQEVIEFKKTGRLIIPISIDEITDFSEFKENLKGIAITEESLIDWKNEKPSEKVLTRIIGSFKYRKRIKVIRNAALSTFLLIAVGICFGLFYSFLLSRDISGLKKDKTALESEKVGLKNEQRILADSIQTQNDLINLGAEKAARLSNNISQLDSSLQLSLLLVENLNDSANSLYASNLIGLLKNEELNNNNISSISFDPFNVNRRMLLALESYRANGNTDAEKILQEGVSFLGRKILERTFEHNVIDISNTHNTFDHHVAIILSNGDVLVSEKNKKAEFKTIANIDGASKLLFYNPTELSIMTLIPSMSELITINLENGNRNKFTIPLRCKKFEFDDDRKRGFFLGFDSTLIAYNWENKEILFQQDKVINFDINKNHSKKSENNPIKDVRIAIWKSDTIFTYSLDKLPLKQVEKAPLESGVFSNLIYFDENFIANGFDMGGIHEGLGIDILYFKKPEGARFSDKTQHVFAYGLGIRTIGFANYNRSIYFSSARGRANCIHFMEMFGFASAASEQMRIMVNSEIIKLCYDSFYNALYGIDSDGKLIGWDVTYLEEGKKPELKGQALMNEVCDRLLQNFTREEWDHFFPNKDYCKTCAELK